MLRSLFAGISGLRAHQQMMDITGNNISNVNTTGYKASQAVFEDALSQSLKEAGAPQTRAGGTNPAQIGLGVRLAGINTNFNQGSVQNTGRSTDLMISGDGFFVVQAGADQFYTRAGAFSFDSEGKLVTPDGARVQGWVTDATGAVNTQTAPADVVLPTGALMQPRATDTVTVSGNLPGNTTGTAPIVTSITAYDVKGQPMTVSATFTKVTPLSWSVQVTDGTNTTPPQNITFDQRGQNPSVTTIAIPGGLTVNLAGITGYAGASTVAAVSQTGYGMGELQSFTISPDGMLVGVFSNGQKQSLAQVAVASFSNAPGLEKASDSRYRSSVNSGTPQLGQAGLGGRGLVQSGSLEMSNVDLAQEFTSLIIAQRGFQANSKVISASDELLQDLVNLKR
jgi:flagellar hook protein FlgE